jgi:hypothetical protein
MQDSLILDKVQVSSQKATDAMPPRCGVRQIPVTDVVHDAENKDRSESDNMRPDGAPILGND